MTFFLITSSPDAIDALAPEEKKMMRKRLFIENKNINAFIF